MEELDFLRRYPGYYVSRPDTPEIITVGALDFIMIDGQGTPTTPHFGAEGQALMQVAEALKAQHAAAGNPDYRVGPLEAVWWTADGQAINSNQTDQWRWTAMVMLPGEPTPKTFSRAALEAWSEHGDNTYISKVRFETLAEGTVVQALYVGHPAQKAPLVEQTRTFAVSQGYTLRDKYHEIYLATPLQVPLEHCQTIVRQPLSK